MSRIGNMNDRILIQRLSESDDGYGGKDYEWTNVKSVWSEIIPLSGRSLIEAQKVESVISHRIRVRYQDEFDGPNSEIKSTMRIIYGALAFRIHAVLDQGDFQELVCSQEEVVS